MIWRRGKNAQRDEKIIILSIFFMKKIIEKIEKIVDN